MEPESSFRALLYRVRDGDGRAAEELVRQFEPDVRRAIRLRLTDPRYGHLRRVLDSVDICNSVLGNFFVRAALGQFDLETPNQLVSLLVTMAHNKLVDQARRSSNRLPIARAAGCPETIADGGDSPVEVVAGRELIQEVLRRLSAAERRLVELRASGLSWDEVAVRVNSTSEAVRKRLERAIRRVEHQLGLEGDSDDGSR
jgi:RNA polymerase sigma-70 factor (ECF subfamily)